MVVAGEEGMAGAEEAAEALAEEIKVAEEEEEVEIK